jgi:hypothetical protein
MFVFLAAEDVLYARYAPVIQRSGGLYVALKAGGPGDSNLTHTKDVIDEWDTRHDGRTSASFLSLVDHELSAYRLVQRFVNLNSCKGWLQRCFSGHEKCCKDLGTLTQDGTSMSDRHFKLIDI